MVWLNLTLNKLLFVILLLAIILAQDIKIDSNEAQSTFWKNLTLQCEIAAPKGKHWWNHLDNKWQNTCRCNERQWILLIGTKNIQSFWWVYLYLHRWETIRYNNPKWSWCYRSTIHTKRQLKFSNLNNLYPRAFSLMWKNLNKLSDKLWGGFNDKLFFYCRGRI